MRPQVSITQRKIYIYTRRRSAPRHLSKPKAPPKQDRAKDGHHGIATTNSQSGSRGIVMLLHYPTVEELVLVTGPHPSLSLTETERFTLIKTGIGTAKRTAITSREPCHRYERHVEKVYEEVRRLCHLYLIQHNNPSHLRPIGATHQHLTPT